ncbi:hypothetical protein [Streptomyces sp. NBC_00582]|uniref:hypothetical protein n=1 Tax=Streptomyces sp. NBC_00582 TaxID=2975783 RepID=UPI002E808487|nr:hypothetical protein [Streptomyces sp. NBC_00582]WUB64459.1 hypothetical protein OG852_30725 [Streptomyces sp. NBC_00582]
MSVPGTVELVADEAPDCSHLVWPRQYGKGTITAEFTARPSPGFARLMSEWEAAIAARRTLMLARLADDLGKPLSLVRRQADAVDRLLEAAGIADGYGQLVPQALRPPIPAPPQPR